MNTRILSSLLALSVLALPACTTDERPTAADPDRSIDKPSRTFEFTYATTIPAQPVATRRLSVWVPVPHEDPRVQSVSNLEVSAPTGWKITREPVYGNRMIHVTIVRPAGPVKISWKATITRWEDGGQGSLPTTPRYLAPNKLIPIDADAVTIADRLQASDTTRPIHWRAKRIFDDVLDGMEYNKLVAGYGLGDFKRAITVCKGNCTDFHARFIGVARAAKIPVRFTMGIPMKAAATGRYNSYHCWAHYHDGRNWNPVDISEADKIVATDPERARWYFRNIGKDRIGLSYGRDIMLSPPQKSAPLNYFVFPHAEKDGEPLKLDKSMWEFSWRDVGPRTMAADMRAMVPAHTMRRPSRGWTQSGPRGALQSSPQGLSLA